MTDTIDRDAARKLAVDAKARWDGTPSGPWVSSNDAVPWTPRQRSAFDDLGASISTRDGSEIIVGGLQDEQGGAVGALVLCVLTGAAVVAVSGF